MASLIILFAFNTAKYACLYVMVTGAILRWTEVKTERVTAHPSLPRTALSEIYAQTAQSNEQTPRMGYRGLGSAAVLCWCNRRLGLARDGLYMSTIDLRHKNDLGTNITHRSVKLALIRMAYLRVCAGGSRPWSLSWETICSTVFCYVWFLRITTYFVLHPSPLSRHGVYVQSSISHSLRCPRLQHRLRASSRYASSCQRASWRTLPLS